MIMYLLIILSVGIAFFLWCCCRVAGWADQISVDSIYKD